MFELLRRDPRVRFDPHIAHAGLIYEAPSRLLLADVHGSYLHIARQSGLPMIAFADTWRASAERVAASPFRGRSVNRDNVEFLRAVADASGAQAFVGALTGPRGDAYRPEESPSFGEALRHHAAQIAELAQAGVDLLVAATLPAFEEAKAIAVLMSRAAAPWMLSFVVRPNGVLLDGTLLGDAIDRIDNAVDRPPAGYSINCVHPEIVRQALAQLAPSLRPRVIAFQGNTSPRTPEELDNLAQIESTQPDRFAGSMMALMGESSISIAGGCCGTDGSHITALAGRLSALSRTSG